MSKSYVIRWKSKVNGRIGKGSRLFEKVEAETLAAELNAEYPEISHEVIDVTNEPDRQPTGEMTAEEADKRQEHALSE